MKFGLANLSIVVGIAAAAVGNTARATELGDVKYRGDSAPNEREVHYNASFINSQNQFENRQAYGLLGFDEESAYYTQRNAEAKSAIRNMGSEHFKKFTLGLRRLVEFNPAQFVRSAASVAATGAAVYSGQTFKFGLGEDFTLSTRAAFSSREGYFATLSRGGAGFLLSRAMVSTEQAVGAFALIPAVEVNSQVTVNDSGAVSSTLSKNIASGLDLSVAQAMGGNTQSNSQVKVGYGLSF